MSKSPVLLEANMLTDLNVSARDRMSQVIKPLLELVATCPPSTTTHPRLFHLLLSFRLSLRWLDPSSLFFFSISSPRFYVASGLYQLSLLST